MLTELNKKSVNVKRIARKTLKDDTVLSELLEGVLSKKEKIRFNIFKVLLLISEERPKALYDRWDFFADLLSSTNAYFKYIAIHIITNLTELTQRTGSRRYSTSFTPWSMIRA